VLLTMCPKQDCSGSSLSLVWFLRLGGLGEELKNPKNL